MLPHVHNNPNFDIQPDGTIVERVSPELRYVHHAALPDIAAATQMLRTTFAQHPNWQNSDGQTRFFGLSPGPSNTDYSYTQVHFSTAAAPEMRSVARMLMDGWGRISVTANGALISSTDFGSDLDVAWFVYRRRGEGDSLRWAYYAHGTHERGAADEAVDISVADLPAGTYRVYMYRYADGYMSGYAEATV